MYDWPIKPRILVKDILKQTAILTGVSEKAIMGKIRTQKVARARHKFFYDCQRILAVGCYKLAYLTGFNHTAILYGIYWHGHREELPQLTTFNGESHRRRSMRSSRVNRKINLEKQRLALSRF